MGLKGAVGAFTDAVRPRWADTRSVRREVWTLHAHTPTPLSVVRSWGTRTPRHSTPAHSIYPLVGGLLLAAAAGGLMSLYFSINTTSPCPCPSEDWFCMFGYRASGGADAHLAGAAASICYAGIGLFVAFGYLVWRFWTRLSFPFLTLVIGFPVLYGCLLTSAWAVARIVWGPTRCLT
jgi:hypothetical protein